MDIDILRLKPWVLLPGTLTSGAIFDGFLDVLNVPPSCRRVISLRHPAISDYTRPLQAEMQPGAVVCGFSLGAIVAAHHTDRLDAAVFILFGLNPHADDPAKATGRRTLAEDARTRGAGAALDRRLSQLHGPDPEGARAMILTMAQETSDDLDAQTALAISRPGALDILRNARAPVIALSGTLDAQCPPSLSQDAADAARIGRFVALDGLGHYALIEDPSACARAVADNVGEIA